MVSDLHFHTLYSNDANNDPAIVLPIMARSGVSVISSTDHDALEANAEFAALAGQYGIRHINGVELDADHPDLGHFHILGYGFDVSHPEIIAYCEREQAAGKRFLDAVLDSMINDGYLTDISVFEAWGKAVQPNRRLGLRHCWKWLSEKGALPEDAAKEYVKAADARGDKSYRCPHPAEAINVIRRAGGVAVFAHPILIRYPDRMESVIDEILGLGAVGVEAYTPSNKTDEIIQRVAAIGRARGVLVTGGSDFHAHDERIPEVWPSKAPDECGRNLLKILCL